MSGEEQERIGQRILLCGMGIMVLDFVCGVWILALTDWMPPQALFLGLAIAATLVAVGGPVMLWGQSKKFREQDGQRR